VPPGLRIVSGVATLVALVQLARLAVFIVAPSQVAYSTLPSSGWEVTHSCTSAYFVAARAADEASVYDDSLYSLPGDPTARRKARVLDGFRIDVFEYPPPFLLLPRALRLAVPEFLRFRMLWFGLCGGFLLLAMLLVARALGPPAQARALLLVPIVWAAFPVVNCLQKGNLQLVVIAAAMLGMLLIDRRRPAAGGALLAFATVAKLYPGVLLLYLAVRREWSALGWTAAMIAVFVLLGLVDTGWGQYAGFLDHLPRLLSGEAFPAFRSPSAIAINLSVPGVVFKLQLFGVPGMSFGACKIVGWVWTLVLVAATISLARRTLRDDEKPLVWLTILFLATLRSPFLPQAYGGFAPLWMLALLAATRVRTARGAIPLVLAWLALNVYVPMDAGLDPRLVAVLNCVPQAVMIALAFLVLRRKSEPPALAR
jgi:hypothetical protein